MFSDGTCVEFEGDFGKDRLRMPTHGSSRTVHGETSRSTNSRLMPLSPFRDR